jgi:hypothetical protein
MPDSADPAFPCPCCGYLTSSEPGSYDICPICGWEDDLSQLRFAAMAGGANDVSLFQAQRNFVATGSSDPMAVAAGRIHIRPPIGEVREPDFRLVEQDDLELPGAGVDQGATYPADYTDLYYWRSKR